MTRQFVGGFFKFKSLDQSAIPRIWALQEIRKAGVQIFKLYMIMLFNKSLIISVSSAWHNIYRFLLAQLKCSLELVNISYHDTITTPTCMIPPHVASYFTKDLNSVTNGHYSLRDDKHYDTIRFFFFFLTICVLYNND